MKTTVVRSIVITSLAVGCGGGSSASPPADAGPGDPADAGALDGGAFDAGAATRSAVTGRRHERCHQLPSDVDVPVDLSLAVVQVFVHGPDGDTTIDGTGGSDGRFAIPDVPDGVTYLLRLDNTYYATDQHTVDVRSERMARCRPVPDTVDHGPFPVNLRYAVTGLSPIPQIEQGGDGLNFVSLALDFDKDDFDSRLQAGATSAAGVFDWRTFTADSPLIDASAGDDLQVLHVRSQRFGDPINDRVRPARWLIDRLDATGATLAPGHEASIAGAAQPAAPRSLTFSLDTGALDREAGPNMTYRDLSLSLTASPLGLAREHAVLLSIDLSDRSRTPGSVQAVTALGYGDPFPDTWTRALHLDYVAWRAVFDPRTVGNSPIPFYAAAHHEQITAFDGTVELDAALHAPDQITVGGADFVAGGQVRYDGQAAVPVAWRAVVGATAYRLKIYDLEFGGAATALATFWTTEPGLQLPATVFAAGLQYDRYAYSPGYYMFVLDAVVTADDLRAGHAITETTGYTETNQDLRLPLPIRIAGRVSGRLHLVAHCGDGVVQPSEGEECDTRGESATCNADCTLARCGDGLLNVAADEQCDNAGASVGCTASCLLARCGDGTINGDEDCDDGNALDDGNGCSATCKRNNICGDGILQDVVELCDPGPGGDAATCDVDCTPAYCGDGHVNRAAGEECDVQVADPHCQDCRIQ